MKHKYFKIEFDGDVWWITNTKTDETASLEACSDIDVDENDFDSIIDKIDEYEGN